MKRLLPVFMVVASLAVATYSCSREENFNEESNNLLEADQQMAAILSERYAIETNFLSDGNLQFEYPNGQILEVDRTDGEVILSGSRINNAILRTDLIEGPGPVSNRIQFSLFETKEIISKQDFIKSINRSSNLENNITMAAAPCDEHPSDETFNECFAQEWEDFCDGLAGCLAQATNPVIIAAVIAIHCGVC